MIYTPQIKHFIAACFVLIGFLWGGSVFAHPGNTDAYGCHTCRTNCPSWGLSYGEYHCHNSKGLPQPQDPISSHYGDNGTGYTTPAPYYYSPSLPSYTPQPSCPLNATYDSLSGSCKCNSGYFVKDGITGQSCVSGTSYCFDKYGLFSSYNSLSKSCECTSGYIMSTDILGNLSCTNGDTYCHNKYGLYSDYNSLSKACECDYGYQLQGSQCVKKEMSSPSYSTPDYSSLYNLLNSYSTDTTTTSCPANATEKSDGKCYCDDGYKLNDSKSGCIKVLCSANATVVGSGCVCNEDYTMQDGQCITHTENCIKEFGANVQGVNGDSNNSTCSCASGYQWNSDRTGCVAITSAVTESEGNSGTVAGVKLSDATVAAVVQKEKELTANIDSKLANRLKGKILLQVEEHGEAWYVSPKDNKRYYMANGVEAYNIMRNMGVGITNSDLTKIQTNTAAAKKQSGKIFLQVEEHGEAYYVDFDGNTHYLKDGDAAYAVMHDMGLGVTNSDIRKIDIH
jgi:hypothetical protein